MSDLPLFTRMYVLVFFLLAGVTPSVFAQRGNVKDTTARPIAAFNFQCTSDVLPKRTLDRIIRAKMKELGNLPPYYEGDGRKALAYDLNGDGVKEYFVFLRDEGIGDNVVWGILGTRPSRLLGTFVAEHIYIRRRVADWSALTISKHLSLSDSLITTFGYRNGRYVKVAGGYEVSATRNDEPKFAGKTPYLCDRTLSN